MLTPNSQSPFFLEGPSTRSPMFVLPSEGVAMINPENPIPLNKDYTLNYRGLKYYDLRYIGLFLN